MYDHHNWQQWFAFAHMTLRHALCYVVVFRGVNIEIGGVKPDVAEWPLSVRLQDAASGS